MRRVAGSTTTISSPTRKYSKPRHDGSISTIVVGSATSFTLPRGTTVPTWTSKSTWATRGALRSLTMIEWILVRCSVVRLTFTLVDPPPRFSFAPVRFWLPPRSFCPARFGSLRSLRSLAFRSLRSLRSLALRSLVRFCSLARSDFGVVWLGAWPVVLLPLWSWSILLSRRSFAWPDFGSLGAWPVVLLLP